MLELIQATEAQKLERDRVTAEAWAAPLSLEGYLRREVRLRAHPFSREGMRTWLLVEDGRVLSSCETFRQAGTWFHRGDRREVPCEAVASVFTEVRLRGRQYARTMMTLLGERLAAESPLRTSALYSDVGAAIYEHSGYVAIPEPMDWMFPVGSGAAGAGPLQPEDRFDERHVERALSGLLAAEDGVGQPERYRVWPSVGQVDWHLERERILSEELGRPRPAVCGARVGGSTWLWMANFRAEELYVLIGNTRSAVEARGLVTAASRACQEAGLARVRLWETPAHDASALREAGGQRIARDGSLPMIHPLRSGIPASAWHSIPRVLWV